MPDGGPALYVTQLIQRKEGYPLWEPDPKGSPPVEIADVGYIKDGGFLRLFNASKPVGDPINLELGVPDDYKSLKVGVTRERAELRARFPIVTGSISHIKTQGQASGGLPGVVTAGAHFDFQRSRSAGAILILGEDAQRTDIRSYGAFLSYIFKHHASWLEFANNVHGFNLTLDDLMLVTGCDKTTSWASAAFSESLKETAFNFNAGQGSIAGAGAGWGGLQIQAESPYARFGPTKPSKLADQCVFIRGYKICNRTTWLAIKAGLKAQDDNGIERVPVPWSLSNLLCCPGRRHPTPTKQVRSATSNIELQPRASPSRKAEEKQQRPTQAKERSPMDIMLHYMLEKTEANLAVAHDDDLVPLLKPDDHVDDFQQWIENLNPKIHLTSDNVAVFDSGATHQVLQGEVIGQEAEDEGDGDEGDEGDDTDGPDDILIEVEA